MVQTVKSGNDSLQEIETRYRRLLETAQDGILILDGEKGIITDVNPYLARLLGYAQKEFLGKTLWEVGLFADSASGQAALQELKKNHYIRYNDLRVMTKSGQFKDVVFTSNAYLVNHESVIQCSIRDITEHKQTKKIQTASEVKFRSLIEQSSDGIVVIDEGGRIFEWNRGQEELTGLKAEEVMCQPLWKVQFQMLPDELKSDDMRNKIRSNIKNMLHSVKAARANRNFESPIIHTSGKRLDIQSSMFQIKTDLGIQVGCISRDITDSKQHERELEAINTISAAMRVATSIEEMLPLLLDKTLEMLKADKGGICLFKTNSVEIETIVSHGWNRIDNAEPPALTILSDINSIVFTTGKNFYTKEVYKEKKLPAADRKFAPVEIGDITLPIRSGQAIIGTISINVSLPREISQSEIRLLTTLSEIVGNAITRMRSHEKTLRDAKHLAALYSIDVSINSNNDLKSTFDLLLEKVINSLNVSAADVLLLNPHTLTLEFSAGKGFKTNAISKKSLRLGEGYAGRAALQHETLNVPDLQTVGSEFSRIDLIEGEGFVAYYGVPLINKGKVIGVLDIFNRAPLTPDKDWLQFMEAIAGQAAIAIDSATLFNQLQHSNLDLLQAYDSTIEGWSMAMDLRDHETEGHTQRVTEMTLKLAKAYGMRDEELLQIKRGALLHDIGKMGIPDGILLKAGPLTDEEWVIMRKHPQFAFEMLSPIEFLRPALDIPYCHHEKWDGSGYPRGLKGKQIPVAARLFAVIDVWDALSSDRPYRKAWSQKKVMEYIQSLSGTHFDPQAIELFIKVMSEKGNNKA